MNSNNLPKFDLTKVDEAEHLIPRPYGTLQTLNLDHLFRYAFAKAYCYNSVVLDAAMGCGYSSLILNCKEYIGVDIDENMAAFPNQYYKPIINNASYLCGSVLDLPVDDHSIDTYISFETIEHLQPTDLNKYFAEVKRVLKKNGFFLCSTPIYRGDNFGLLTTYHPFEFKFGSFESTLINSGFVVHEIWYQWPPTFTLQRIIPTLEQTQQLSPFLSLAVCKLA